LDPHSRISLADIFALQEVAAKRNLEVSDRLQQAFATLSDCIGLGYEILHGMTFVAEKQTVLRAFAGDALSHVLVGFRVALWGDLPESMSILRGATESAAQLLYVVENNLYALAVSEFASKKFKRIKFENVLHNLGETGKAMAQSYGRISNLATHSTVSRLAQAEYEIDGETYDRFGFAIDANAAHLPAYHSLLVAQLVIYALAKAHQPEHQSWGARALAVLQGSKLVCQRWFDEENKLESQGSDTAEAVRPAAAETRE